MGVKQSFEHRKLKYSHSYPNFCTAIVAISKYYDLPAIIFRLMNESWSTSYNIENPDQRIVSS